MAKAVRRGPLAVVVLVAGLSPLAAPSAWAAAGGAKVAVTSVSAQPGELGPQGGTVKVSGSVEHARTCQLQLLSRQAFPVVYATNSRPCTARFSAHVTVGANPSGLRRTVAFALVARNSSSSFAGRFYILVAPAPAPRVTDVSAVPPQLGPDGGPATVTGAVRDARSCQLELLSQQDFPVIYASNVRPCTGAFRAHVLLGANTSHVQRTIAFGLVARRDGRASTGRFYIVLAGSPHPAPPVATTTVPVTTTTTPVRTTTSTTRPAPARATAPVSASNFYQQQSPNWSGYAVGGGPFSSVAGTFSIPSLGTTATCDQELGEWVGVDGQNAPNLPPDPDLIQAGIGESLTNPVTGSCTPGQFWFWSWWEVLPAPAVPVELPMSPGDKVSVTISQLAGGTWGITLHDDTDGQEFNTEQPYSGHGSSSEWIVEAPVDPGQCGAGEAPGDAAGICALAPFSPVEFSDLKMSGRQSSLYQIDMWQGGDQVATPSGLSGGGFAVNYSGPLASLTAVAHNPVGGVPQGNFLHPVYYQPRSGPYEHN